MSFTLVWLDASAGTFHELEAAARKSLRSFLMVSGFREVVFVEELAPIPVASPVPAT